MRHLLVTGVIVAMLTGCQVPSDPVPGLTVKPSDSELVGSWVDKTTSREAPAADPPGSPLVIATYPFSYNECGGDATPDTTRLALGWPVGTAVDPPYETVNFVREPPVGAPAPYTASELDTTLPDDAPAPRFSRNGNSLHIDPKVRWVFVQRSSGRVERWGRVTGDLPSCA